MIPTVGCTCVLNAGVLPNVHRAVVARAAVDAGMVGAVVVTRDEPVARMVDAAVMSETEVASKVKAEEEVVVERWTVEPGVVVIA